MIFFLSKEQLIWRSSCRMLHPLILSTWLQRKQDAMFYFLVVPIILSRGFLYIWLFFSFVFCFLFFYILCTSFTVLVFRSGVLCDVSFNQFSFFPWLCLFVIFLCFELFFFKFSLLVLSFSVSFLIICLMLVWLWFCSRYNAPWFFSLCFVMS